MAIIVTQTADNAYHIKDAFRAVNRDYYPYGVYEAIFGLINEACTENQYYNIDAVAWACDISETALAGSGFDDITELEEYLNGHTTVLYVAKDGNTVYHLAF